MICGIPLFAQTISTPSVAKEVTFVFDLHEENGGTHFLKLLLKY